MSRISAISLLLITSLVLAAAACGSDSEATSGASPPSTVAPAAAPPALPTSPPAAPALAPSGGTTFSVSLQDPGGSGSYIFDPSDLTFSVGDTVTFVLTAENEFHTFTVDDLGIDESVDARTTIEVTFTFDTAGTFEIICVPHQALGMVGTITVQ